MKQKFYTLIPKARHGFIALALGLCSGMAHSQTTYTFAYTGGAQTLALQATSYSIEIWGGDGGNTTGANSNAAVAKLGGKGGYARGTLVVTSPQTATIYVGGRGNTEGVGVPGGFNGGGSSGGGSGPSGVCGSGGGASDVRLGGNTFFDRQIVAGGGGAAGYQECNGSPNVYSGGHGGGLIGGAPVVGAYANRIGQPGTQTSGGAGGSDATYVAGNPGSFGLGGGGGTVNVGSGNGAGGGGGWYGGGGGSNGFYCAGGGGGGSSYIGGVTSATTIMFGQPGFVTNPDPLGNGYVIITELCSINIFASGSNSLNPAICSGQQLTLTTNAVSNYSWSNGQTTSSIVVAPTTNTVYSLVATSSLNCSTGASRSVSVNSAAPVLSISNPSSNICLGRTVSLSASGALSYTWANPGVANGQTFTPSATAVYTVSGSNGCGTTVATTTITVAPLAVTASASSTLVCQGYTAALTATSAVSGYTWMPGSISGANTIVAPLANTLYTVTASDGTCSGTQTVLVNTKITPTIVITPTLVNMCPGQVITLNASGAGTGGSYSWTPGNGTTATFTTSPASSTLFVVAGTNSLNCTASAQVPVVVDQPLPLNVSASSTLVCSGASVNLNASGSTSYSWTNGPATANYLVNQTAAVSVYTVTGYNTTNTCTATRTIAIAAVIPNVNVTTPVSMCVGGTATVTATGANTYTFNGTPTGSTNVFYPAPAQTSTLILTANTSSLSTSCLSTRSVVVNVNQLPTLNIALTKTTAICKGNTNTLTASGAVTYTWATNGSTATAITVSPNVTTIYSVTGTDANGCQNGVQVQMIVSGCNGVMENNFANVTVYPNPNNGQFFVKSESAVTLVLNNAIGQQIQTVTLNKDNGFSVEIKDLAKGVYYLRVANDTEQLYYTRLVVN